MISRVGKSVLVAPPRRALPEGLIQIGHQVIDILDADGQPNQGIADSKLGPFPFRNAGVRHDRRMINKAFDPSQAFRERKYLAALEKAPGMIEVTLDKKGDDRAKARHLPFRQLVLRM